MLCDPLLSRLLSELVLWPAMVALGALAVGLFAAGFWTSMVVSRVKINGQKF